MVIKPYLICSRGGVVGSTLNSPQSITYSSTSATAINLSINAPSTGPTPTQYYYYTNPTTNSYSISSPGTIPYTGATTTSPSLTGFSSGTLYTLYVASNNSGSTSAYINLSNVQSAVINFAALPESSFNTLSSNTISVNKYTGANTFKNGTYTAAESSWSESKPVWHMMWGATNTGITAADDYWHCNYKGAGNNDGKTYTQDPYNPGNGNYQGGGTGYSWSTTAGSTAYSTGSINYNGEWIQIKYPYKLQVIGINLYARYNIANRNPATLYVLGSNDGSVWNYINTFTNASTATTGIPFTISPAPTSTTPSYYYYRIIINKVLNNQNVTHFSRIDMYGNYFPGI